MLIARWLGALLVPLLLVCCSFARAYPGNTVVGIDFGDSCARVSVSRGFAPLDRNAAGSQAAVSCHDRRIIDVLPLQGCLPSFVAFQPDSSAILIGAPARARLASDPANVVSDFRALLGRTSFEDPAVQQLRSTARYKIVNGSSAAAPMIQVRQGSAATRRYHPVEIAAMLLGELKAIAERHLGARVTHAILAAPIGWSDAQRQALKDAGTVAGLNVLRIMNEPTATASAYGIDLLENRVDGVPQSILLLSMGGSHTDVSVLRMDDGAFEIQAHIVGPFGGRALDRLLLQHFEQRYRQQHGMEIAKDAAQGERLGLELEKLRETVTAQTPVAWFSVESVSEPIDQSLLDALLAPALSSLLARVDALLSSLNLTATSLARLVVVGGLARMESVTGAIEKHVGLASCSGFDPADAVARGLAIAGSPYDCAPDPESPVDHVDL